MTAKWNVDIGLIEDWRQWYRDNIRIADAKFDDHLTRLKGQN